MVHFVLNHNTYHSKPNLFLAEIYHHEYKWQATYRKTHKMKIYDTWEKYELKSK